jgi:hypothetical protein
MVAIGMGVLWAAYLIGIYGYCLVRGYDVPFGNLLKTSWVAGTPAAAAPGAGLPPTDPGVGTSIA